MESTYTIETTFVTTSRYHLQCSICSLADIQVPRNSQVTEAEISRSSLSNGRNDDNGEIAPRVITNRHEDLEQLLGMAAVYLDRAATKWKVGALGRNIVESTAWPLVLLILVKPA